MPQGNFKNRKVPNLPIKSKKNKNNNKNTLKMKKGK